MIKSDQQIKAQAILRNEEQQARRKKEYTPIRGEGNTVIGSIHDCSRVGFEKALRAYWDKLYVGWNPFKQEGRGCWEVWQRPSKKTPILRYHNEETGEKVYTLEYLPNDFEHWVADLEYLSYDFIGKLRSMDSWTNKNLTLEHDNKYDEARQKADKAEDDNIKYVVRHNKKVFRDLLDYTQAGFDPLQFFTKK